MFDYLKKNRNQRKDKINFIFTDFKKFKLRFKKDLKILTKKQ